MVIHFESREARLRYLKGELEEIVPKKVEKPKKKRKKNEVQAEQSGDCADNDL